MTSSLDAVHGGHSLVDVLDRVLDKGIVIDAWVRVALVGIDLVTVEARVVIASIDTYIRYAKAIGAMPTTAAPRAAGPRELDDLTAENAALRALLKDGIATQQRAPAPRARAARRPARISAPSRTSGEAQ
jgi:gas vesicle structural protein